MKIPESLRVGAQVYTVGFDKNIRDSGLAGECNFRALTIKVLDDRPPTRIQETFCHELVEAVNYEYGINLRHKQVTQLGMALYQILRDNPGVFLEDGTETACS